MYKIKNNLGTKQEQNKTFKKQMKDEQIQF